MGGFFVWGMRRHRVAWPLTWVLTWVNWVQGDCGHTLRPLHASVHHPYLPTMNNPSTVNAATAAATPIQDFSQCHVGILSKLEKFSGLPALLSAAAQARTIAQQTLDFFRVAVFEHHSEEERQLFPAVQDAATAGDEKVQVKAVAERLTREHRDLESRWKTLEPGLKRVAKGQDAQLDVSAIHELVALYTAHARFEEAEYLPLAYTILSRQSNRMDALALALHLRHAPQVVGYV